MYHALHIIELYISQENKKKLLLKKINLSVKKNPELLKSAFELKLLEGWRPTAKSKKEIIIIPTVIEVITKSIAFKKSQGCSDRYIKDIERVLILWKRFERENNINNLKIEKQI